MEVHLVDGTYELFRHHYGRPDGRPYAATRGVLAYVLNLLDGGATHLGVASDHVIESVRNDLWADYKTSEGMPPELLEQIPVLEGALAAMGITVWPMVEWEADDALASAAAEADADARVERIYLHTPDKDLAQCVRNDRVVQVTKGSVVLDEEGVIAKYGVAPASIPDYLALVGDKADGYPGLAGWGAKSAAAVLARYDHIDAIPLSAQDWDVPGLRNAERLARTLQDHLPNALLFRRLATLEIDEDVGQVDDWRWTGPHEGFPEVCERLGDDRLAFRAAQLASTR